MTVASTPRVAGPFNGNGVQTQFPIEFKLFEASDLAVFVTDALGVQAQLTSNYTVLLNDDQDNLPGGTLTYPVSGAALPTGQTVVALGDLPIEQTTDITNVSRFLPQVLENALDYQAILSQQIAEKVSRSLLVSPGEEVPSLPTAAARANMLLSFDSNGNPIAVSPVAGSATALSLQLASSAGANAIGTLAFSDVTAAIRGLNDRLDDTLDIRAYGAKGDGVTVDTVGLRKVFDKAIFLGLTVVDNKGGTFLTGPLNWNGTGHATPANQQYQALKGFRGAGRLSTTFKATGTYGPNDYVLTCNNFAGCAYSGFGVDGDGISTAGIDFSWIGGSQGDPGIAPSCQNIIQDIFQQGCSGIGINLQQQHDSKLMGLWSRGVSPGNYAMLFGGAGGQVNASHIYASNGVVQILCQNGGFDNFGFFGGVELAGSGYNNLVFNNGHLFANTVNSCHIACTGVGNATRGVTWNGCYFNVTAGVVVTGNLWQGMLFNACQFNGFGSFAGTIVPSSGAGNLPLFDFNFCSFEGSLPGNVTSQYNVSFNACRTSTGVVFTALYVPGSLRANTMAAVSMQSQTMAIGPAGATPIADCTFNVQNGLARISGNAAGVSPVAGAVGLTLGYNLSGGRGESFVGYGGTGGSAPGLDFRNMDAGTIVYSMLSTSFSPGADNSQSFGTASKRISTVYAGTAAINTSDERYKQDVAAIPDAVLDAWGAVQFVQYRFIDAVEEKGDKARWHFGVIAQRVQEVFAAHGLDAMMLGLLCYDEWADEFETVPAVNEYKTVTAVDGSESVERDENGAAVVLREITPAYQKLVIAAGNRYGIRYEEALVLEAAWQRRQLQRLWDKVNGAS